MYNILLVDDHQLVAEGFKNIIEKFNFVNKVDHVSIVKDALIHPFINGKTIIISDIEMPEINGIDFLKLIKKDFPNLKIMMLSMFNEPHLTNQIIQLGADGYLLKSANENELEFALNTIVSDGKYFCKNLSMKENSIHIETNDEFSPNKLDITKREKEIIQLIALGNSNKQIADKLFISIKTVDTHRVNLMKKLNIHNAAGITRFAIQNKYI